MANIYKPKSKEFIENVFPNGYVDSNNTIYAGDGSGGGGISGAYAVGDTLTNQRMEGAGLMPYDPVFAAKQAASQQSDKSNSKFNWANWTNFTVNGKPLRQMFANLQPNLGWTSKSGLQGFGKNLGKQANVINSVYQLANAASAANALDKAKDSYSDVAGDIITSANSNPLLYQFLTSDQMAQIRALKKSDGELDSNFSDFLPQDIGDFGNIAKGALIGGITGGIPGAVIGGLGNAVSGGIENVTQEQQMSTQELEALLSAVQEAEMQYKSMKRPALGGLGIQQRYLDMYR